MVEQTPCPIDDISVTDGEGIERSGIDSPGASGHADRLGKHHMLWPLLVTSSSSHQAPAGSGGRTVAPSEFGVVGGGAATDHPG